MLRFKLFCVSLLVLTHPNCAKTAYFPDAGDKDSGPAQYDQTPIITADAYQNPCAPNPPPSITGKVFAPNGLDPVSGAAIYVPLVLDKLPAGVHCMPCNVTGKFSAHTYTAPDGSFKLEGVPNGTFQLAIEKGHFRRVVEVTVPHCGHSILPKTSTTLPGKKEQYGPYDEVPNIAVITGAFDRMEKVIQKLGVETMSVYNGRDYGTGPESIQALLFDFALLSSYHLLFINCGTVFEPIITEPGPARDNLRAFVKAGGRLFVTDFSYDYVEQVFPEFIDFESSEEIPHTQPEIPNAAELGTSDLIVKADIQDDSMRAWLGLPEIHALDSNHRVEVQGFMTGWAVQYEVNKTVGGKVWTSGDVKWAGGTGVRPLNASFNFRDTDHKGCGRVLFSSYHTHGEAEALLPQERILEFLMLEIGTCLSID